MTIKIDLLELSKDRMSNVTAGEWVDASCWKELRINPEGKACGCACAGPSGILANSDANYDGGLYSPCQ